MVRVVPLGLLVRRIGSGVVFHRVRAVPLGLLVRRIGSGVVLKG
jgi:hypothetical protein